MRKRNFTDEQDQIIIAKKVPDQVLAERFGVTVPNIRARRVRIRRKMGIKVFKHITPEELANMVQMRADGFSLQAIADHHNRPYGTVRRHISDEKKRAAAKKPKVNEKKVAEYLEKTAPGVMAKEAIQQMVRQYHVEPDVASKTYWTWRRDWTRRLINL